MVISRDFISRYNSLSIRVGRRVKAEKKKKISVDVNVFLCVFNIRWVDFKLEAKVRLYRELGFSKILQSQKE